MLIKRAEDPAPAIAALEARAARDGAGKTHARAELARRRAGHRGEAESSYLIDFDFAGSPNWAVLHDLRIEHGSRTAQIDHLLVNRWMEFFVLETKHFATGIRINEDGEFLYWNGTTNRYQGIASPLQQNERHIAVLSDVLGTLTLPSRLGIRIAPTFHSLVLVASGANIIRPRRFDTSRVIKADQLKPRIWREIDDPNPVTLLLKSAARLVSAETVRTVAEQLAALHRPVRASAAAVEQSFADAGTPAPPSKAGRIEPVFPKPAPVATMPGKPASAPTPAASNTIAPPAATGDNDAESCPRCRQCGTGAGEILYGRHGYYFRCDACSANTSIRFACGPGHSPRLRKQARTFHRDCPECGTSRVFHHNREAST